MSKKLTIDFICAEFEKEGYILLTEKYINAQQKLDYICPEGHKHSIRWGDWSQGKRCLYCSGKAKKTIEEIRIEFEKENYILLTKEYKNNSQKLDYICPKGHRHSISWSKWRQGVRCPYRAGNVKLTIDFICAEFEKEGYILLTEKYINAQQKLDYICPRGHEHSMNWTCWQRGHRCYYCGGSKRLTIDFIRSEFKKEGYILLTNKYKNNKQKLDYVCPRGHKHLTSWGDWKSGFRCPKCALINAFGSGNPNWKGGISKEPYCQDWGNDLKEYVKERDGFKCLNPDCWCKDNTLAVHHIDYNKKSCGPENLITVCRSCNSRANSERNWHKAWYQAILNKRYGYIYNGS